MSAFFACLRLEQHVGCSPSTLRAVMEQLEPLILETIEAWEREGIAQGQIGPIVGSVDETFLERMMLVCMDLVSGYVLLEEVAAGEADVAHWEQVRDTYRGHLEAMSLQVHPWRVTDSMPQSSQEVEAQLADEVAALQVLLETNGLRVPT